MSEVVSFNPSFNQTSRNVSEGIRDGFIAVPITLLAAGEFSYNEHTRETGLLGSEAISDAYIAGEVIKFAGFRERRYADRFEGSSTVCPPEQTLRVSLGTA